MTTIGLLHPGSMGAAIGGQLVRAGHQVLWCPEGRSTTTVERAASNGLTASDLPHLLADAEVVLSICPPAAAEALARTAQGYAGIWVEANAITPQRTTRIASLLPASVVVDGGIVGSPPTGSKHPTLYLSGPAATDTVADMFTGTDVRTSILGNGIGQASALKLSYSSFQKASRVLAAVSYGLATEHDVEEELLTIAGKRAGSYLTEIDYIPKTAARAWRWGPELIEAADMLRDAGLPDEMLRAAAAVLARWEQAKDDGRMDLAGALKQLHQPPG
ncbi:NAD(P)-dependent oxidoreductase [Streptomyces vinaceus]|uniref:NAD(P)-dependent oxidoreductase n=1 Tax=Streptomyces vinaceus TaxID=1960 RepID=UPI0038250B17